MTNKTKISQETKDKLRDAVTNKLFLLPAFRLREKQINVINTYALSLLDTSISRIKFNRNTFKFASPDNIYQSSQPKMAPDFDNFQGWFKKIKLALRMTQKKTWINFFVTLVLFLAGYFLFRQANFWLKLMAVIFTIILPFLSFSWFFDIYLLHSLVSNTFGFLYRILNELQFYINNINLVANKEEYIKERLETLSNQIAEEFIHEEIRQLDYNSKKIHFFVLIVAFSMSSIVIVITGDLFVIYIKQLAKLLNLLDLFPIIKNLNLQTFWLIFLFPLSIAWARDLVVEHSKKYSKELHQSLFFMNSAEKE